MKMKKTIVALTAVVLMTGMVATPAFAHGGRHSRRSAAISAPVAVGLCNIEDCYEVGDHRHDSTYYNGHRSDDGHAYHQNPSHEGNASHKGYGKNHH